MVHNILPLLLQVSYDSHPVHHSKEDGWHYLVDGQKQCWKTVRAVNVFNKQTAKYFEAGRMSSVNKKLALALCAGDLADSDLARVHTLAKRVLKKTNRANVAEDPWLSQLDWAPVPPDQVQALPVSAAKVKKPKQGVLWPAWYWEQAKPKNLGVLDITVRNSLSPILLRLSWLGWPLFRSREHGWIFRVPRSQSFETRARALQFFHDDDATLATQSGQDGDGEFVFYKLPHKDGEEANVGSPLTKTFMKYAQDGTMTSPFPEARDALDMSAQCSYWISARDRIMSQMPVWQTPTRDLGFRVPADTPAPADKWGVILPQMTAMGTITRRAIERTWLTASNAKKNRVGSELKAMVRAPPGYALVGADVDAEELWISSLMGDAQFGLHGATAIGWMTLEGTKSAGTDLHSKTGSILRISRDQAKVFNYSRIYGAGMRHAILLLLQASAGMTPEKAHELAEELYAKTKGKNTYREDIFGRKFWYGGSESFVFNKLEEIAISDRPQTPALGCGVTSALAKQNLAPGFGNDYMTSRVNWVVQSSGVDYLHLLIVSMDHLIRKYGIRARYLISVHDEVRYLVHEEDRFRAALAMQIANLWTRGLFAFKLGMDDLPQGVAFFSAVDVDSVLRKEADMTCVTPSQPTPLPPGESLGMEAILERTGGTLWQDARPMDVAPTAPDALAPLGADYVQPNCLTHRAKSAEWLQAQSTSDLNEILLLATAATGFAPSRKPKRQYNPRKDTPRKPAVSTPDHDLDAMFLEQQASAGVGNVRRRDMRRMADEIFA
jgi:DNA polymerase gamma 1